MVKNLNCRVTVNYALNLQELWTEKKNQLSFILNEKVKEALLRSRFLTLKDMDSLTSFYFFTWSVN